MLTILGIAEDGVGGVTGLARPKAVAVSGDGAHVYVAAGGGVTAFDDQAAFIEATPLPHPRLFFSLAVSPDGARVVGGARGPTHAAVVALDRDPGTGTLARGGGDGFEEVRGVAVSPDSRFAYAASTADAVGVFGFASFACSPAPMFGCVRPAVPGASSIDVLFDPFNPDAAKIAWKWVHGGDVGPDDFGDPVAGADHVALCLYDPSAAPQPLVDALAPAAGVCAGKPCWKRSASGALKYKDRLLQPDGILGIAVRPRPAPSSSIKLRAKGRPIPLPDMPLTPPVTVQLQSATGRCWEAIFGTPLVNDDVRFKSRAD
jgi:hypothetical protein